MFTILFVSRQAATLSTSSIILSLQKAMSWFLFVEIILDYTAAAEKKFISGSGYHMKFLIHNDMWVPQNTSHLSTLDA